MKGKYLVGVTGLTLKSIWNYPGFAKHAVPCFMEAQQTVGNIKADTKKVGSVHHTFTVWESREAMMSFVLSDTHRAAMKDFDKIATGKTISYWCDKIPTWDEALEVWRNDGKTYKQSKYTGADNTTGTVGIIDSAATTTELN